MQHDLVVMPQVRPLSGSVPAPSDEGVAHLALLVAALADGESTLTRMSSGPHVEALIAALRRLGIAIEGPSEKGELKVRGRGVRGLSDPGSPIDCGASLPTLRRLAAVLAAHRFASTLTADSSADLSSMTDVAAALRRRYVQIEGAFSTTRTGELDPPFTVGPLAPGNALSGVEYAVDAARTDVKEALLLSGLYADEATFVREPMVSRDHLERLLQGLDVPVSTVGSIVSLDPADWSGNLAAFSFDVPGDTAFAALLAGLATTIPASRVCVRGVGLNASRIGAFELVRQMGGEVEMVPHGSQFGETEGTICTSHASLRATAMDGELWHRASDDWPVLVALASRARGACEVARPPAPEPRFSRRDANERAESVIDVLAAFGVEAQIAAHGGMVIGGRPDVAFRAADIDAAGDPARATIAVMLGMMGDGPTRVRRVDAWAARFPRIVGTLRALGADVRVEPRAG
ncbi:MAG: 3-phosphoshikimate 1-carboxyvinyltransferase [Polyangiaceae bacterium]